MKKIIYLLPLLLIACSSTPDSGPQSSNKFEEAVTIGSDLQASRYDDIYFSAQPKMEDFKALKEQGFTHIVNLRRKNEYDEKSERKAVVAQGMSYTYAPFSTKKPLVEKYMNYMKKRIMKHRSKGKTLIHCSSGNRVAAWAGAHFHEDHGYSKEAALGVAKKIGLKNEKMVVLLQNHLGIEEQADKTEEAKESADGEEASEEEEDSFEDEE